MRFRTYLVAFLLVLILMVLANYSSYLRMQHATCDDCFIQFGFPFWVREEGGYVGVTRVLWAGMVADLSIAVWVGLFLGWTLDKLLRRESPRPNDNAA